MKKTKWRSAEEKRKHYDLQESWKQIKEAHGKPAHTPSNDMSNLSLVYRRPPGRSGSDHIPSLNSSASIDVAPKKEVMKYTGTNMKGISMMHKSNLVPTFSEQEIKDHANMRR